LYRWYWLVLEFTSWLAYPPWIVKLDSDYSRAGAFNFFSLLNLLCGVSSYVASRIPASFGMIVRIWKGATLSGVVYLLRSCALAFAT